MDILVADDDVSTLGILCEILENEGFSTAKATGGEEALSLYKKSEPDFICLDITMPDMSGYEVCRKIREENPYVPIIFLSSRSKEIDKVLGLELGADDYITKPFGAHEVIARIRAIARRALSLKEPEKAKEFFVLADLKVYPSQLRADRGGEPIDLSLRDTKILELFYNKKNEVVDRDMLLDNCWGRHVMPDSRIVDQHISQLRKRIEKDPSNPAIITTVHGAGYRYGEKV